MLCSGGSEDRGAGGCLAWHGSATVQCMCVPGESIRTAVKAPPWQLPHLPPSRPALDMLAAERCLQDTVQQEVCLACAPFVPRWCTLCFFHINVLSGAGNSQLCCCNLTHVVRVCVMCVSYVYHGVWCMCVWVALAMQGSWQGHEGLVLPALCHCV